jgi:catechol 2,3-dioxygenase-like lactoylglutathione lyase family enzyme
MITAPVKGVNVKQAVPFFGVTNMEASLQFYVNGLGFKMKHWWIPDRVEDNPDGRIRWCWLELGGCRYASGTFARTLSEGTSWDWNIGLLHVRRRPCALSRVQIARNTDVNRIRT